MKPSSEKSLVKDLKNLTALPDDLVKEKFQLHAYYDAKKNTIKIEFLYVPVEFRRYGYATRFIESILILSDFYKVNAIIEPSEKFGLPIQTLEEIYTKWGFTKTQHNYMIYAP